MSMISVDYDVLNQKGSPAWYSDVFANLPTAGYKGRMFISIDTYAFYRDTGTGWDLIGGPGTGTITGSGVSGQVSYFNGTSTLAGSNNLFWDNTNGRLGIGTTTPGAALDIHSTGTNAQFNGTGTNNAYLVFQNAGVSKWRIGNNYNGSANSFQIYNNTSSLINLEMTASGNTYFYGTASFNVYGPIVAHSNSVIEDNISYAAGSGYTTFATTNSGSVNSLKTTFGSGFYSQFLFTNTANYQYTFPATTGTLALTSNLSSFITLTSLSFVAGSGAYNNTTGVITIPTNNNQITNGAGYITSSSLSSYLPLTGGTLTGQLYINPTNTGITGLDVASDTIRFRSDNLEGFKRQLEIVMGSGTLVQITAKGYLANYGTDLAFYTATSSGVNASPGIYITGTNNRVGIKTGTPDSDLQVAGTCKIDSTLTSVGEIVLGGSGNYPTGGTGFRNDGTNLNIYYGSTACLFKDSTNVERLRITSSGELCLNTTSALGAGLFSLQGGTAGYNLIAIKDTGTTYSATDRNFIYFMQSTGGTCGSISHNSATTVNYYTGPSDERKKENIKDWTQKVLPLFADAKPKTYNHIEDYDNSYIYKGFLAQDMVNKFPEAYGLDKDGYYTFNPTGYIIYLVKAIQELNEKLVRNNIN